MKKGWAEKKKMVCNAGRQNIMWYNGQNFKDIASTLDACTNVVYMPLLVHDDIREEWRKTCDWCEGEESFMI